MKGFEEKITILPKVYPPFSPASMLSTHISRVEDHPPDPSKRPQNTLSLTPSQRKKFKDTLEEFDRLRFQGKKYTRKTFEIDFRQYTRITSQNTAQTTEFKQTQLLGKKKDDFFLIQQKKKQVEEKLVQISDLINQKSSHSASFHVSVAEKKGDFLSPKQNYYVLKRINPKTENFSRVFQRVAGKRDMKSPFNPNDESTVQTAKQTGKITVKNDKLKNRVQSISKAILVWNLDRKKKKKTPPNGSTNIEKKGLRQIGIVMVNFLRRLRRLKLSLKEVLNNPKIFSSKPFEREGSYIFFTAVKENDLRMCLSLISRKKYYIYDFNQNKETPLHLAIKYKYEEMALSFIDLGSDLDAEDIVILEYTIPGIKFTGRENSFIFGGQANPWKLSRFEYKKLCLNQQMIALIGAARRLDLVLKMTPPKYRDGLWQSERRIFE